MEGFNLIRNDRAYGRGGGLCVFVRHGINYRIIDKSEIYAAVGDVTEFIFVELQCFSRKFLVGLFYNPPRNNCTEKLFQKPSEISLQYNDMAILGDFNIDPTKYNAVSNQFCSVLEYFGFGCVNDNPTHHYQAGSSLIDLLMTNNLEFVQNFNQVSAPGFSRHDVIFASLNIPKRVSVEPVTMRNYARIDLPRLEYAANSIDWSNLHSIGDVDMAVDCLNVTILELFESFVPIRISTPRVRNKWFNNDILRAMIERDLAYRYWIDCRNDFSHSEYKRLRNRVTTLINKAKASFIQRSVGHADSSRVLWKRLKDIAVRPSNNASENVFSNTAEEINNHFATSFTTDEHNFACPPANPYGFRFSAISENDVILAISSIKSNAVGSDNIPIRFLKLILPSLINPITFIFNLIISTSKFPRAWKMAKILPIRKKGKSLDLNNLRPISILCTLSKMFEKIVKRQINDYLNATNLLNCNQSGFRSGHSTTTALLKVHDDIHATVDKKGAAFLMMIDFSKAFDRVSHVKLLRKLSSKFNFSGIAVNLIQSYLSGRTQVVSIDGICSDPVPVISGVPQGSVLGPLLFCLFINDLPEIIKHCQIHMFADDVQLYLCSSTSSLEEMARQLNDDLMCIQVWSDRNMLPINASKSNVMVITRNRTISDLPVITLGSANVLYVDKVCNLGIIFQSNLEWDHQVNAQCGKIYAILRQLKLSASMLPPHLKLKIAKTLILPHLTFGSEFLLNASAMAMDRLRIAINHCIRWIFKLDRYARMSRHHKSFIGCSFYEFFKHRTNIMIQKIYTTATPDYLYQKLIPFRSNRVRKLVIPRNFTSHYNGTLFVRGIVYWNQLPDEIKMVINIGMFKRECLARLD